MVSSGKAGTFAMDLSAKWTANSPSSAQRTTPAVAEVSFCLPRLREVLVSKLSCLEGFARQEVENELEKFDHEVLLETNKIAAAQKRILKKHIELADKIGKIVKCLATQSQSGEDLCGDHTAAHEAADSKSIVPEQHMAGVDDTVRTGDNSVPCNLCIDVVYEVSTEVNLEKSIFGQVTDCEESREDVIMTNINERGSEIAFQEDVRVSPHNFDTHLTKQTIDNGSDVAECPIQDCSPNIPPIGFKVAGKRSVVAHKKMASKRKKARDDVAHAPQFRIKRRIHAPSKISDPIKIGFMRTTPSSEVSANPESTLDPTFSEDGLDTAWDTYMPNDVSWKTLKLVVIPVFHHSHYTLYTVKLDENSIYVLDTIDYVQRGSKLDDHHKDVYPRVIMRINTLLGKKSKGALREFTDFRIVQFPCPYMVHPNDCAFLSCKYMEHFTGEPGCLDNIVNPEKTPELRAEHLHYLLFHPLNEAKLPPEILEYRISGVPYPEMSRS
ncbi:hypothetical protein EJB05_43669, partial [Eragrostis curvula]